MDITELEARTGLPRRAIRYLISLDLVPAPANRTAAASYGEEHLAAIERFQRLQKALGLKAPAIKLLFSGGYSEGLSLTVAHGVELRIDPSVLKGGDLNPRHLANRVEELLSDLSTNPVEETNNAQHSNCGEDDAA